MKGQAFILFFSLLCINCWDSCHHFSYPGGTGGLLFLRSAKKIHHASPEQTHCQLPLKTTLYLLFLLSSGDIHPNPGPGPTANCGICERAVSWSHQGICCDKCDLWHHRSCTDMCSKDYSLINRSNVQWYCFKCETMNVLSFTFSSYEINPSYYDPISEVNFSGDSLNGHFIPLQTSSPVSNPKTPSPNQKEKYHHAKQNPKTSDSSFTSSTNQKRKSNLHILTIDLRSII